MSKNCFLGCKVDKTLFDKVNLHPEQNSVLLRKAIGQYFRRDEPNEVLHPYDVRLTDMLQKQVDSLTSENNSLRSKIEFYHIQSMGYFKRRAYLKQVKLLPVHKE